MWEVEQTGTEIELQSQTIWGHSDSTIYLCAEKASIKASPYGPQAPIGVSPEH